MEDVVAEPFDAWRGVSFSTPTIYPELQAEGWARDFTRLVQSARKQAGFNVTDRVEIVASVAPELEHALREFKTYVTGETLAVRFDLVAKVRWAVTGKPSRKKSTGITWRSLSPAWRPEGHRVRILSATTTTTPPSQ